jgi:predicted metal-binding membrane protein
VPERDRLSPIERIIRRDRLLLGAGLAIVAGLAWLYLIDAAAAMGATADEAAMHAAMGMDVPGGPPSIGAEFAALWIMWTVMMAAMMLASAAPVALLVLAGYRQRAAPATRGNGAAFIAGYLGVWSAFSAVAAGAQIALREAALLSPHMAATSRTVAAIVLIGAGVYQWLPIKSACLAHCQSPLEFLMRHWRDGARGAFLMGARHGAFCVGCCWMLMALLFVGGVMNLLWVAAIAAYVLVEKQVRFGAWLSRAAGLALIGWGAATMWTA